MTIEFDEDHDYEVALEILRTNNGVFRGVLMEEEDKENPRQFVIDYCKLRLQAVHTIAHNLRHTDKEIIMQILDKNNPLFRG